MMLMFYQLLRHWEYTHVSDFDESPEDRAVKAHDIGIDTALAMLLACGTTKKQSYIHDIIYGMWSLYTILHHPLRGAMQGFEHANADLKGWLKACCIASGKKTIDADGNKVNACDCLQYLDLARTKRLLVLNHHTLIPKTVEGARRAGATFAGVGKDDRIEMKMDLKVGQNSLRSALDEQGAPLTLIHRGAVPAGFGEVVVAVSPPEAASPPRPPAKRQASRPTPPGMR
jgi:hypothetical protein